mmetsp:Transcript_22632/g.37390  ORF Transcript_22632/g.37390 Transcript_22632/m.37390 type:complete len:295 (+) Transcript_22632:67-951(+)|eukprot:CAMPEP_0119303010 /NCGR_PEP_ID=MMETSP1333-20130426/4510_1 /TAXON_ID=418940 /ORGANISM="Scyphosphaera apsteinii, Strain RCC1455" /LENGTH=294 /DNA_ID=CAMNT_0007305557 /DNA_START=71 /DNA_END=955 /DNA_ORIENTATION=-
MVFSFPLVLVRLSTLLRASAIAVQLDLFPDPQVIGGNAVVAPAQTFPLSLDQPATFKAATVTPFPISSDIMFAPTGPSDFAAAFLLGIALFFGPDFILAPAGLVSDKGIRPGYAAQRIVGEFLTPEEQWLKDRREGLAAKAPIIVTLPVFTLCVAVGLLLNRLLLVALEDAQFVISAALCSCIGCGFLELIRQPLPTREERDLGEKLRTEFLIFSTEKLAAGGNCHERDIVRAFRAFYPRYRRADMSRTADGVSLPDDQIGDMLRSWNNKMGRPGVRTSTGYWKGISVAPADNK